MLFYGKTTLRTIYNRFCMSRVGNKALSMSIPKLREALMRVASKIQYTSASRTFSIEGNVVITKLADNCSTYSYVREINILFWHRWQFIVSEKYRYSGSKQVEWLLPSDKTFLLPRWAHSQAVHAYRMRFPRISRRKSSILQSSHRN